MDRRAAVYEDTYQQKRRNGLLRMEALDAYVKEAYNGLSKTERLNIPKRIWGGYSRTHLSKFSYHATLDQKLAFLAWCGRRFALFVWDNEPLEKLPRTREKLVAFKKMFGMFLSEEKSLDADDAIRDLKAFAITHTGVGRWLAMPTMVFQTSLFRLAKRTETTENFYKSLQGGKMASFSGHIEANYAVMEMFFNVCMTGNRTLETLNAYDLSLKAFQCLGKLVFAEKPMSAAYLLEAIGVPPANKTAARSVKHINDLVRLGYAEEESIYSEKQSEKYKVYMVSAKGYRVFLEIMQRFTKDAF